MLSIFVASGELVNNCSCSRLFSVQLDCMALFSAFPFDLEYLFLILSVDNNRQMCFAIFEEWFDNIEDKNYFWMWFDLIIFMLNPEFVVGCQLKLSFENVRRTENIRILISLESLYRKSMTRFFFFYCLSRKELPSDVLKIGQKLFEVAVNFTSGEIQAHVVSSFFSISIFHAKRISVHIHQSS